MTSKKKMRYIMLKLYKDPGGETETITHGMSADGKPLSHMEEAQWDAFAEELIAATDILNWEQSTQFNSKEGANYWWVTMEFYGGEVVEKWGYLSYPDRAKWHRFARMMDYKQEMIYTMAELNIDSEPEATDPNAGYSGISHALELYETYGGWYRHCQMAASIVIASGFTFDEEKADYIMEKYARHLELRKDGYDRMWDYSEANRDFIDEKVLSWANDFMKELNK